MLTADNAWWCVGILAIIGAICGAVMWLGREKPTDWDAPAGDLDPTDNAFLDVRAAFPEHTRGGVS